jgi:CBS domain-containing protein
MRGLAEREARRQTKTDGGTDEEELMKVSEVMTRDVQLIEPTQTIRDAARLMAEMDAGIMPVREGNRLVGMITDRDIAIRAVAQGRGPDTLIREVMTDEVKYCYEDDDTNDVARSMADIQVRRLPVLTRDKRLVGIISLSDMAISDGATRAGEAVAGISQPGGQHSQTGGART